jgi:triacylglycerol esterase/lipase EstA (alpha/beta hydrolase family)
MTQELQATGEVAAQGLREATTSIEAVHRQIARRAQAPPAHDAIAAHVYAGVRAGLTLGARGVGLLASATSSQWVTPERERAGRIVRAALNGAFGDALERSGSALSIPMAVRVDGADVPLHRGALADAFPDATERVAVFVHGLGEADSAWRGDHVEGYPLRLRADLGYTSVLLRYNSGLSIAENGEQLSRLLSSLQTSWPVELRELALVGHSMGGLVIRAACHAGTRDDRTWVGAVRSAIYLGAPHGGAALEKGARLLATTLRRVPETRALAGAIDARSVGVRDLGDGVIGPEHVPLGAGIRHHAVAATIGGHAVLGHALGDLLVRRGSASGRGTRARPDLAFEAADVHHLANANHFALLCHPAVYEQLRAWLAPTEPVRRGRLLPRRSGADGRRRWL